MIDYRPLTEVIKAKGLRIVLVQGFPSPWGQAAKTMFEIKGLDYMVGPQLMGEENKALVDWSGQRGGPVVAWNDEKPIHNWVDILYLAERLAPTPALIPADALQRALMFGMARELLGELGLVWNRRLQMVGPAIESGAAPEALVRMAQDYGYNKQDAELAVTRTAEILKMLAQQLTAQYARGAEYFIGDTLTALDVYWVTCMNVLDPLPPEKCPIPENWRPGFVAKDAEVTSALVPILRRHRDKIFAECFRDPMEL